MAANPVAVSDTTGRPQTKPLLPSKSKLNWGTVDLQKQAKKEEKEKQKRRAEVILKTWELLVEQDKEERHAKLKEKVALQRQLISKVDQHIQHVRRIKQNSATGQQRRGQPRQCGGGNYIPPVYRPCQRRTTSQQNKTKTTNTVAQQQKKESTLTTTATTMTAGGKQSALSSEQTRVLSTTATRPLVKDITKSIRYSTIGDSKILKMLNDNQENVLVGSTNQLIQFPENRILRFLGIEQSHHEQVKIEDMWTHMKSHSDKQLRPLQMHLNKLEQSSSPSVKECLQLYNQPTACDYYTGKSIALSDALKELRKESPPHHQYTLKMSKSLATLKSRCGQRMLERANLGPDHDTSNQDWFVGIPIAHQCRPKSAPGMINHSGERGSQRRRREATADNNKKTSATTRNDASISSPLPSQPTTNCSSSSNWEPLSLTALGDSASVCNRITSGHGSFRNGRVKLWNQKYSHF